MNTPPTYIDKWPSKYAREHAPLSMPRGFDYIRRTHCLIIHCNGWAIASASTHELAVWLAWEWAKYINDGQRDAMDATPGPLIAGQADG